MVFVILLAILAVVNVNGAMAVKCGIVTIATVMVHVCVTKLIR